MALLLLPSWSSFSFFLFLGCVYLSYFEIFTDCILTPGSCGLLQSLPSIILLLRLKVRITNSSPILQDGWCSWVLSGVLEQTEIEISAHCEVRPDLLIPLYFKVFSLQAPLLKKLHWVIHTDGQFRGYSTESYSSGKPTRLTKEEKAARVCPEDIKEVITGMVIGDSCLIFPQGYGKGKARIQIEQKDKPFVDLLWALFDSVGSVGGPPNLVY
jgi:hypothetical protein